MRVAQACQDSIDIAGDRLMAPQVGEVGSGEPGRVVQQHPHRDLAVLRRLHREVRHVPRHGGVQGDLALVHQLHDRHRGEDLADRPHSELGRSRRLLAGLVDAAEGLAPHRLATRHQGHRCGRRLGLLQCRPHGLAAGLDRGVERLLLGLGQRRLRGLERVSRLREG